MDNPKKVLQDLETVELGWEQNAPDDVLNDIKLVDYKAQVAKSRDVRHRLAEAELLVQALINERDDTDEESLQIREYVVDGARLSRQHGKNSTLVQSFGYKREEDYESGLTRKKNDDDADDEKK
jgi:hypothetical protein